MSKAATENYKSVSTEFVAATFESDLGTLEACGEKVWKNFGYFGPVKSDYSMEKINFPDNSPFLPQPSIIDSKKNKDIFYCNFFILGQRVESSNPPQDVSSYTLKENKLKMVRPRYDPKTGEFKGLYETIGFLVVRGSPEEVFFNYGYDCEKSKGLYSH